MIDLTRYFSCSVDGKTLQLPVWVLRYLLFLEAQMQEPARNRRVIGRSFFKEQPNPLLEFCQTAPWQPIPYF